MYLLIIKQAINCYNSIIIINNVHLNLTGNYVFNINIIVLIVYHIVHPYILPN